MLRLGSAGKVDMLGAREISPVNPDIQPVRSFS